VSQLMALIQSPSDPLHVVTEAGRGASRPSTLKTISSSASDGQPSTSSLFTKPRIIDQNEKAFWTAGRRNIPWRVANL
jgi:hypothetical protein